MKGLLQAGGVALILGVLLFAGRSSSEPKKPPEAPRSRVAVLNLSQVIKNYKKYQKFQDEIKREIDGYRKQHLDIQEEITQLTTQIEEKDTPLFKKVGIDNKLKKLKRDLEKNDAEAKEVLGKKSDQAMVQFYTEVRKAVHHYAKNHDLELIMHYNEADEKKQAEEFWSPENVARKMQAGACMPLYIAPGIDITEELITALNDALREK